MSISFWNHAFWVFLCESVLYISNETWQTVFQTKLPWKPSHVFTFHGQSGGKGEKRKVKWLFEVPCVCSVGTCGALFAYLAHFFRRYSLVTLTPCVSHLPCMSLQFSAGKTVRGKGFEKRPPCPEVLPLFLCPDLGGGPGSYSPFAPKPTHGPSPPNFLPPPNVKQL